MDKFIDARFERLEKALTGLIDSVAKYHPSMNVADELKAADLELSRGLGKVETHQNNHLRILQLREASAALDTQIRETLTSLASTRNDIVNTQITTFPANPNHPIIYDELLSYARRISKTSMPPASTIYAAGPPAVQSELQTPIDGGRQSMTPAAATPSMAQSPAVGNTSALQAQPAAGITRLPDAMAQYLNPLSGQHFFPWPQEDKIRSGALASNQLLVEQGIDPKGFDPVLEQERKKKEEEERKDKEEQEAKERAEKERVLREEREQARLEREKQREKEAAEWRRASEAGGEVPAGAAEKKPEKKQFQFTNLDDLDDDDDDDD